MEIQKQLSEYWSIYTPEQADAVAAYFPNAEIEEGSVRAVLINEVVPERPEDNFYSKAGMPAYLQTAIPLFCAAGAQVQDAYDLLQGGIYLTNAIRLPKKSSAIPKEDILRDLPLLEAELSLFPNLEVIILMGDVAKKAFNMIAKKNTGRNAVPAISTYQLRQTEIRYRGIRVIPSYIMTGANLLIEKSKPALISADIAAMLQSIGWEAEA